MSMQIEFKDEYNQTTYYFGTVKEPELSSHGEYEFSVQVVYFNTTGKYTITEINWSKEPKGKDKAEKRISDMVKEWHGKKCDIHMMIEPKPDDCMIKYQDPGDEHQEKLSLIDVKKANEVIKQTPEYKRGKSIISSIGYRGEE